MNIAFVNTLIFYKFKKYFQLTAKQSLQIASILAGLALTSITYAPLTEAAVFYNGFHWPVNDDGITEVPICVRSDSSVLEQRHFTFHEENPSMQDVIAEIRRALASSWELYSSVRFTGWQDCTTDTQDEFVIFYLHPDADNTSFVGPGALTLDPGIQFQPWGAEILDNSCIEYSFWDAKALYDFACAKEYAIHEFGHLIGFAHEWQHPNTPDTCEGSEDVSDNDDTDDENDWRFGYGGHDDVDDKDIEFIIFREEYDWDSIMTYNDDCADVTGRRFGSTSLTTYDKDAVKAVYPAIRQTNLVFKYPLENFEVKDIVEGEEITVFLDERALDALLFEQTLLKELSIDNKDFNRFVFYNRILLAGVSNFKFFWNFDYQIPPEFGGGSARVDVTENLIQHVSDYVDYLEACITHVSSSDCTPEFPALSISHVFPNDKSHNVSFEFDGQSGLLGETQYGQLFVHNKSPIINLFKGFNLENRNLTLKLTIDDVGIYDVFRIKPEWREGVPQPNVKWAHPESLTGTNEFIWTYTYPDLGNSFNLTVNIQETSLNGGGWTSTRNLSSVVTFPSRQMDLTLSRTSVDNIGKAEIGIVIQDKDLDGYKVIICWDGTDVGTCDKEEIDIPSSSNELTGHTFRHSFAQLKSEYNGFVQVSVPDVNIISGHAPNIVLTPKTRMVNFTLQVPDSTPPVITPAVSGPVGNNGWYKGEVALSWSVTDPESPITGETGCEDQQVTYDTAGITMTCEATSKGGTGSASVTIKRDTLPPVANISVTQVANVNNWHKTDVNVSFSGSDNLSGLERCSPDIVLANEGRNQSASGTCTDRAGNESALAQVSGINIDKTAPKAPITTVNPASNTNGWNNTDVSVGFSGSDDLSGISSCSPDKILSGEGMNQSAFGTCIDLAGNVSTRGTASGINIDKTAPIPVHNGPFSVAEGSSINLNGTGSSDALSGVASTIWSIGVDGEFDNVDPALFSGVNESSHLVALKVLDLAGNMAIDDTSIVVTNVAAVIIDIEGDEINETMLATVKGTFTDPGLQDTFMVTIDWGEGEPVTYNYAQGARSFEQTHQYLDDDPSMTPADTYTIEVSIEDDAGGSNTALTSVKVNNVNPEANIDTVIDSLTGLSISYVDHDGNVVAGSLNSVLAGTEVAMVGNYTDTSPRDIHWAPAAADPTVDWGDGVIDTITIPLANRGPSNPEGTSGTTEAAHHVYTPDSSGDYTIGLTITDDDTGSDMSTATIVVVSAAEALQDSVDDLLGLIQDPDQDADAIAAIQDSVDALYGSNDGLDNNGALDKLEKENNNAALDKLLEALTALETAEAADNILDLSVAKTQLVLTAKSVAVNAVDIASTLADKNSELDKVAEAQVLLLTGDRELGNANYVVAMAAYINAAMAVQGIK